MTVIPIFIETDSETILAEIIADYELRVGRTLQPGQAEYLLCTSFAFREKIIREQIQSAGLSMLVNFSAAPALDYLVELIGVTRLAASSASCIIEFTLVTGHGGVVIPGDTRIGTNDGVLFFQIQSNVDVPIATNTVQIAAFASQTGIIGNGYAIGKVLTILDPQPFIESAANIDETSGGADAETDDELRERANLAPSQFSVAGPSEAYEFFTKTASPDIVDVSVIDPPVTPGTVEVFPLVSGGIVTPPAVITLVENVLNSERIRPLSDTVVVASPTISAYDIDVDITIYTDADSQEVEDTITAALNAYIIEKQETIGADIKIDQIVALCIFDNTKVFDVVVTLPVADIVIDQKTAASADSLTVNITGSSDG